MVALVDFLSYEQAQSETIPTFPLSLLITFFDIAMSFVVVVYTSPISFLLVGILLFLLIFDLFKRSDVTI